MTERTQQATLGAGGGPRELEDYDWTFEKSDTQYLTHGLHSYPARMIPQIPATLLSHYKDEGVIEDGDRVYDPFSGSGTTAVEGRLAGLHAEANDINPLACTLTQAKAIPLDVGQLKEAQTALLDGLDADLRDIQTQYAETSDVDVTVEDVRDGWFPEPQLYELAHIRERIDDVEAEYGTDVARFLRVTLSQTTRKVSYQRNGEYKRYRMPEEKRTSHDPPVYDWFTDRLQENVARMQDYAERVDPELETEVHYADSRNADDVETDSADIVITSPPYGDHGTTVAYGQFSQDPAIVASGRGYDEMKDVDKNGLGGKKSELEPIEEMREWSPALERTVSTLEEKEGRAEDAMDFFRDYYAVMEQVARVLKPGQPVAWVVANRTMSRVNIPTHLITKELCEHVGFTHEHMLPREIPTKTLPWENAPENETGNKGDLMADENIVVMRSPQ